MCQEYILSVVYKDELDCLNISGGIILLCSILYSNTQALMHFHGSAVISFQSLL